MTTTQKRLYLTVQEAADELAMSQRQFRRLLSAGAIPFVALGPRSTRISRAVLEQLANLPAFGGEAPAAPPEAPKVASNVVPMVKTGRSKC